MVELRDRTLDQWRTEHLYRDGLASPADGPEIIDALLALRELGTRHEDMLTAGRVLRARPSVGEFLILSEGKAQRYFHKCMMGDRPEFRAARVVFVEAAEVIE